MIDIFAFLPYATLLIEVSFRLLCEREKTPPIPLLLSEESAVFFQHFLTVARVYVVHGEAPLGHAPAGWLRII
jgi:hypothetical protein